MNNLKSSICYISKELDLICTVTPETTADDVVEWLRSEYTSIWEGIRGFDGCSAVWDETGLEIWGDNGHITLDCAIAVC